MDTSQNYDIFTEPIESEDEKQARLARLRTAEIKRELKKIDAERIRPLAAIVSDSATDFDHEKLALLEARAQALRAELSDI